MLASSLIKKIISITILTLLLGACGGENNDKEKAKTPAKDQAPSETTTSAAGDSETATEPTQNDTKPKPNQAAFSWNKLSGWHTNGLVSRDSPIQINFNRDVVAADMLEKDASKVMHITPAIEGKPFFKSRSSIIWEPSVTLQPGIEYKVSIKPVGLKDVPKNANPYNFSFAVIPLEYEIKTLGFTTDADEESKLILNGQLLVSDKVPADKVRQVLSANSQGKPLAIEWDHDIAGKAHHFAIKDIVKETFATELKLNWNGAPIQISTKGSRVVEIPRLDHFAITSTRVIHDAGTNPYVQVRFSDELDSTQNLKGLVELAKSKFKTSVNRNAINIYPNKNLSGSFTVRLHPGIKAKDNSKKLQEKIEQKVVFDEIKPQVKFAGKGSILPENSTLEIPFEAVGINAVEVTAMKIYPDNMGQFLQVGRLSGSAELGRTGRYLWRKTIPLTPADPNKWNRYSFDVSELMKKHTGGLLRLTLSIKRQHSTYRCPDSTPAPNTAQAPLKNSEDYGVVQASGWDGISDYVEGYNQNNYDWNERNNPCSDSYFRYNSHLVSSSQNFIASNIGLIAKQDAVGNLRIISTDIKTAQPLTGVEFEVKNFQGQLLAKGTSDGSGFATIKLTQTPFLLVAKKFEDTAFLKLNVKTALAVSHFDVGGKKIKKGIKGFIYGERGVWRPGDDIYLTFVNEKKGEDKLPDGHPVTMALINPRGRVVDSKTSTDSVGGFYAFKFKTAETAETGNWLVKASVGGSTFSKSIMIETVRPNRLKLELSFANNTGDNAEILYAADGAVNGKLFSQWLHGASASKLKADIALRFTKKTTRFGKYTDFVFDDPARSLKSQEKILLQGRLDEDGYLKFSKDIKPGGQAAGMLSARFSSRVFEKSGAFSISRSSVDYHPYENYVGIKLPKGDATRGMLLTDKQHTVNIASLSAKGEDVSLDRVQMSLYKINWKWWWDKSAESLAEYADSKHRQVLQQEIVSTKDGRGEWQFSIKYPEWGRYLIRACDLEGKHCTGKTVYIDWPGWAGRAQEEGSGAASRLNLFSDKPAYAAGDEAVIQLPASAQGRALLTVETGSQILEQRWLEFEQVAIATATSDSGNATNNNRKQFKLPITAEMAPNVYVHVSMLQPHQNKSNDRPIRLYGIIPLEVADPETYLKPKIMAEDEWRPASKQVIKVSEESGQAMNYTLAVVDEGLLGLTSFKTPNLHRHFYSKEALGIKTWDLFDEVIGAYGGKLERMLALGGGDEADMDNEDSKKRRFPPVVKYLGPYNLAAGASSEHTVELDPYLGAVRIMLVAGDQGAYGKAEKSVYVRQPLMLQTSLPRTLGPEEEVSVPATLFVMDDSIKDVTLSIKTDELVELIDPKEQQISFSKIGEKLANIRLKTKDKVGKTHIQITATAGANGEHISTSDVYLDINRANQLNTRNITTIVEPGKRWAQQAQSFGIDGSNQAVLEISSVPPMNLQNRLDYLLRYPHGCLEQISSSAFPQLYLSNITTLTEKQTKDAELHVQKAIDKLQRFQLGTGDFSYWPGANQQNEWASIYAGHFLLEAKNAGYQVPYTMLDDWLAFQTGAAQRYTSGSQKYTHTQAYRLYVLAIAGKPQLGAMNRLRELGNNTLNNKARWLLASAYQSAAQPEAASALIQGMQVKVDPIDKSDETFSSTLGDLGLQLQSLVALDKKQDANLLLEQISSEMSSDKFQSTQGIALALMAVSRYLDGDTSTFTAQLTQSGTASNIDSKKSLNRMRLLNPDSKIELHNTSTIKLFANLITQGIPAAGDEISQEKNLGLEIKLATRDPDDNKKWNPVQESQIIQGTDTRLTVTVSNNSKRKLENIAMTLPVLAGMEILSSTEQTVKNSQFDYRDVRDDRVHYYFPLKKGETKTFSLIANAAYLGRYYQPAIFAEAMYDGDVRALHKGRWINIISKQQAATEKNAAADSLANSKVGTEITIKLKASLYHEASETAKSPMYLIPGDKAEVLQQQTNDEGQRWYLIRYQNKLEKWVKAEFISE